jgi:hypothetical protein
MRAKAYDLFKVAQFRKQQEIRAIQVQDDHFLMARRLMIRLGQYFNDEELFWDMLTPKVGVDMLKTLTQLQRVSVGLPAGGPLTAGHFGGGAGGGVLGGTGLSMELLLRQVAQVNNPIVEVSEVDTDEDILSKALDDPEMISSAQDLIIKLTMRQNQS